MGLGGLVHVTVVGGGGAYTGKGKCVTRNTEAEEE